MRSIRALLAVAALAASAVTVAASPAGAEAVEAHATDVELQLTGSCSDNPSLVLFGEGEGDDFGEFGYASTPGDPAPAPEITPSPLFDDWSFDGSGTFGLALDDAPGDGELVGGYAVVGNPDLSVAAEWFVLWECGPGADSGSVLFTCVGPYGTCPTTVDEAMSLGVWVAPQRVAPGGTVAVAVEGCYGSLLTVGFVEGTDPRGVRTFFVAVEQEGPVADVPIVVPTDVRPGPALITVLCELPWVDAVAVPIEVLGPPGTPTTPAPGPARPAPAAPRFTG